MYTKINTIGSLLAACIWADGKYDKSEREATIEIADALGLDADALKDDIETALGQIRKMPPHSKYDYALRQAENVATTEAGEIFQSVIRMILCDGVLRTQEVNNVMTMAEAIGIDRDTAILMLCDTVNYDADIEITFDEDDVEE